MRRPRPPEEAPGPRLGALRPFLMPAAALAVALTIWLGGGFDGEALAGDLEAGRVEAALDRLAAAEAGELPVALEGLAWWPHAARAPALSRIASRGDAALRESPRHPTILAPRGAYREPPEALELREPAPVPLVAQVSCLELTLEAGALALVEGARRAPWSATLLPGASYVVAAHTTGEERLLAVSSFRMLSAEESRRAVAALAAAHDLGRPSHEGSSLLAALAAMHFGLHGEALRRLDALAEAPGYARVVRELRAIALAAQGLDWSARRALESGA